jgi:hypothetical protein
MTLDELIEKGWQLIDENLKLLNSQGGCAAMCQVIMPNRSSVTFELDDPNSTQAKEEMSRRVGFAARTLHAEAVLMCADAFFAELTMDDDAEGAFAACIQRIGLTESIRLGLVERREALICNVVCRNGDFRILKQFYRREGNTDAGAITLGERSVDERTVHQGRMAEFFK